MDAPRRGGPNYSFVGFLLLAAFGTFLWKSIPLESSRPSSSDSQWQPSELDNEVPARLWQDPFKAVFEYAGSHTGRMPDPKQSSDGENLNIHACELKELKKSINKQQIKQIRLIAVMLTAGPDAEFNERRRRRRYAVISGLGAAGLVPESASSIHYCYLEKTRQGDSQNKEAEPYRYIVPYEWYIPDTAEPGADPTYAVLLFWLNETIFASEPMDRFSDIAKQIAGTQASDRENVDTSLYILGPASSDTLLKLALRTSNEMKAHDKYKTYVEKQFTGIAIKGLHILSPIATVPRSQFATNKENFAKIEKEFSPQESCKKQDSSIPCVTFQRTISEDNKLTDLLAKELVKRSSWEKQKNYIALISEWDTFFGRSLPKVFKESYCSEYAQDENNLQNYEENKKQCRDYPTTRLFEYSYLRGIDGRIKGANNEGQVTTKSSSKNDGVLNGDIFNSQDKYNIRRPSGTAQFDYLRRLAGQIRTQNAALLAEGKGRIAAIGILGSDVYDKLLILRALRPQFPHALFFTTDLDAQLLHPADFRWTRNLIVASSFGLNLKRELQGNIPPFRGNYQTSIFLSTLLATKFNYSGTDQKVSTPQWEPDLSSHEAFMRQISPLLFEVGRHGAERLSPVSRAIVATLHPATPKRPDIKNTVYVFLFILLLILVVHQVKPFSGWPVFWSVIALLFAFNLAFIAIISADGGEPMSLTQGISIWPTEFIRYAALCLSIYFISRLIFDLKANCLRISRDMWKVKEDKSPNEPATLTDLWRSETRWPLLISLAIAILVVFSSTKALLYSNECQNPSLVLSWIPCINECNWVWWAFFTFLIAALTPYFLICHKKVSWISRCIPAVALVLVGMIMIRKLGVEHDWRLTPLYWAVAMVIWFSLINIFYTGGYRIESINEWMNDVLRRKKSDIVDAKDYWLKYCRLGRPKNRWYRALSSWLIFMAGASLIFSITGFPVIPCRGTLSCNLDRILTIASVSSMLLLIFLVLDEFRLTILWIKGLTEIKNMSWHGILEDQHLKFGEQLNYLAHEGFKIKLIAERTEEIGRLIYYPFLIIIIVLISRSSYFDNWGLPQGIAIVVAINILLLISAGTKIRYEAEKCRRIAVKKLNAELMDLKGVAAPSAKTDSTQIQQLLEEVKSIRNGAFLPFTEQPLLRASLLLFGAIGITAGEYMTLFG